MEKVIGLITTNYTIKKTSALSDSRPVASMPYLGRYRVVDFALSNIVNYGIRTVGMVLPYSYRSIIDHVGSGRDWGLNRKKSGLFLLPGSAYGTSRKGARFLVRDLIQNRTFIERGEADYVVLSSASFVYNFDLAELIDAHVASDADITMLVRKADKSDNDIVGLRLDGERVVSVHEGVSEGDTGSMDCVVMKRTQLLQLLDWYKEYDYLDLFEAMERDFGRICVKTYTFEGYAAAIFNSESYFASNMDMLNPELVAEVFPVDRPIRTKAHDNAPTKFSASSHVNNVAVAGNCRVAGTVTNSILGRSVVIEEGAQVNNAIIMQSCVIKGGAVIENAIVDRGNVVSADSSFKGTPQAPYIKGKPQD